MVGKVSWILSVSVIRSRWRNTNRGQHTSVSANAQTLDHLILLEAGDPPASVINRPTSLVPVQVGWYQIVNPILAPLTSDVLSPHIYIYQYMYVRFPPNLFQILHLRTDSAFRFADFVFLKNLMGLTAIPTKILADDSFPSNYSSGPQVIRLRKVFGRYLRWHVLESSADPNRRTFTVASS